MINLTYSEAVTLLLAIKREMKAIYITDKNYSVNTNYINLDSTQKKLQKIINGTSSENQN